MRQVSETPVRGAATEFLCRSFPKGFTFNKLGRKYLRAELSNCDATWTGFLPVEYESANASLPDGVPLRVMADAISHPSAGAALLAQSWHRLSEQEECRLWTKLLPASHCPRPELLGRLEQIAHSVEAAPLRRFVARAFSRRPLFTQFLRAPASQFAHHCKPGGLLEHSIEVGELIKQMIWLEQPERDLGIVAGLLHDVGKARTYDGRGRLNRLGHLVRHDTLTLETLAPDLALLDCEWPDGALALRDVFTAFADPNSFTSVIEQRLVIAVRFADRWSAHTNKYRNGADLSGLVGFSSRGHQKFWRPRPWKHDNSRQTSTV